MHKPFFSVIIPTYNRSEFLKEAIQSVLAQTYENFELIVIDDHSTDDTKEVVASFRDARIIYLLNNRTKGGAGARNTGIFRATGEWIAFLDDDDLWLPHKLEKQYIKIQEVDDLVGLIYSGRAYYDFDKKQERVRYMPEKEGWILNDLLYNNYIGTFSSVSIRTSSLKQVGGLDERFPAYQDAELYVRIAISAKVVFVNELLVYCRSLHEDRITRDFQKKLLGYRLFWKKYDKYLDKSKRLRQRIASKIFTFALVQGSYKEALRVLPWVFLGILYDLPNFIWTIRMIAGLFIQKLK